MSTEQEELKVLLSRCMELLSEQEAMEESQMLWEDAVAALAYALRTAISGDSQEAVWAARRAYEAADRHVLQSTGIVPSAPGAELQLLTHPVVQHELARQARDLDDLERIRDSDPVQVRVSELLRRAAGEGQDFLGP